MPWPILFSRTYAICRLLVISCVCVCVYGDATASLLSSFQETRSLFLSIFCLFPHFEQVDRRIYLREPQWKRRRKPRNEKVSVESCAAEFEPGFTSICNQITTIVFFSSRDDQIIYHNRSVCSFSYRLERERERMRERKVPLSLALFLSHAHWRLVLTTAEVCLDLPHWTVDIFSKRIRLMGTLETWLSKTSA